MTDVREVQLDDLKFDHELAPREYLNENAVNNYAESIKAGEELPPIDVFWDGSEYWVGDDWHRTHAHHDLGRKSILCRVHEGKHRDALFFAARSNASHGLHRSTEDKRRAIIILLNDPECRKMSNSLIAKHCKVSQHLVQKARQENPNEWGASIRVGGDGRLFYLRRSEETRDLRDSDVEEDLPDGMDLRWSGLGMTSSSEGTRDVYLDRERIPVPSHLCGDYNLIRHTCSTAFNLIYQAIEHLEKLKETDGGTRLLDLEAMKGNLNGVKETIKNGIPYCMCPRREDEDHDDECVLCKGSEFIPEGTLNNLTERDRERLRNMSSRIR